MALIRKVVAALATNLCTMYCTLELSLNTQGHFLLQHSRIERHLQMFWPTSCNFFLFYRRGLLDVLSQPTLMNPDMSTRHLPVELWTQIFEHFQLTTRDYEGDMAEFDIRVKRRDDFSKLKTLRSICLVSKSFHQVAWPILYRVFPFTRDSLQYEWHFKHNGGCTDELYLQALHRNPAYADALRFIYMDASRPQNEFCPPPPVHAHHVDGSYYVLEPGSCLRR